MITSRLDFGFLPSQIERFSRLSQDNMFCFIGRRCLMLSRYQP